MRSGKRLVLVSVLSVLVLPKQVVAFNDAKIDGSPCTFINKGTILGTVQLSCPELSEETVRNIELYLEEQTRNLKQKNDHIDLLNEQIAHLQQERDKALAENKRDRRNNPDNALLVDEQDALKAFDLRKAAELREQYYQVLKQKGRDGSAEMRTEIAKEAFIAAKRWEDVPNMAKALSLYQEAVEFKVDYREAWQKLPEVARKMGDLSLALKVIQNLKLQIDAEKDQSWLAVASSIRGDIFKELGDNLAALREYQASHDIRGRLADAESDNPERQYELFLSYNKIGDVQLSIGDDIAVLGVYENSLVIVNKLAKLDFKRRDWQRDLLMSYDRLGRMHLDMDYHIAALMVHEDCLKVVKELAELAGEQDTEWQRDLSISYDRVGDVNRAVGDPVTALVMYEESFWIRKRLAELEPNVVKWKIDLMISHRKLSQVQSGQAETLLSEALTMMKKLNRENKLDNQAQEWIEILESDIKRLLYQKNTLHSDS